MEPRRPVDGSAATVFLPPEMLGRETGRVAAGSTDGGSCSSCAADAAARAELQTYAREPFERSFRMTCSGTQVQIAGRRSSERKDPCRVVIAVASDGIAYGHSHPYVTNYTQLNGEGCFGEKSWGLNDDVRKNRENKIFSDNDRDFAKNEVGLPFYLIVPDRSKVKVYRRNENGRWRSEDI